MEDLIPLTNDIRDSLAAVGLDLSVDLPHIAVIGGQSVGKSSLLECLVGRDFLPTGTGVTTRRPLILRLTNTSGSSDVEWGEFQHLPGQRFENFDELKDEIARDTDYVCGMGQAVSATPIVLHIHSPKVLSLVLVDLPGVTRVPVGDQPHDIEMQLRKLVLDHVSASRCLILAVVAGNADLATADALAIAREVDPSGERTIGVVTKLDLAESSSEMLAVLEGRVYPLPRGFVGVICRSRKDVQSGKTLRDHLANEAKFFQDHPELRRIAHSHGIAYLAKYLNHILLNHICDSLPEVKGRVAQLISLRDGELQAFGDSVGIPAHDRSAALLNLIGKFAALVGDTIEGKRCTQQSLLPDQLFGRARIDFIFSDIFARTLREFDCWDGLSTETVCLAIRNATGSRLSLFMPEEAFEQLARRQIKKLEFPSMQCVELVYGELLQVLQMSDVLEFHRFQNLGRQVLGVARTVLKQRLELADQMIKDLIKIELAYINTSHPDFMSAAQAPMQRQRSPDGGGQAFSGPNSSNSLAGDAGYLDVSQPDSVRSQAPSRQVTRGDPESDVSGSRIRGPLIGAALADADPRPTATPGVGGFFSNLFRAGTPAGSRLPASNGANSAVARSASTSALGQSTALPINAFSRAETAAQIGRAFSPASFGGAPAAPGGGLKLAHVPPSINAVSLPPTRRELVEVDIVKTLLVQYLTIVKKNIADSVPKSIMCLLVADLKDAIQSECIAALYKEDMFAELFSEARDIQERRKRCQEQLEALHHVSKVMDGARQYVVSR